MTSTDPVRSETAVPGSSPVPPGRHPHPRALQHTTFAVTLLLSVLGALIGVVLITGLGVAPNTSVIGALLAMMLGKAGIRSLRSPHRQNLIQSGVSGSTFAAANTLITPMAIPYAMGEPDLVWPMLCGAVAGLAVDSWVLFRVFDSRLLPATAAWPSGVAAAETISAGDKGGRKAGLLSFGMLVGVAGTLLKLPASAAGVALIGNVWAMATFGGGLLLAQYGPDVLGAGVLTTDVSQGMMIGAALAALFQAALLMRDRGGNSPADHTTPGTPGTLTTPHAHREASGPFPTTDAQQLRSGLLQGLVLALCGAMSLAAVGGVWTQMSPLACVGWIFLAGVAAVVHQLIVGLAAMASGWFPAFAVSLLFLTLGALLHIPPVPLALLVGYTAATGPAFADLGFDFKAGWLLRKGSVPWRRFEIEGRRQQYTAQLVGFAVAIVVVAASWQALFTHGHLPPLAKVYGAAIRAGSDHLGAFLPTLLWAVPGALLQLIGGPTRQVGIMLATGLLVALPHAGWMVLAALGMRGIHSMWLRRARRKSTESASDSALLGAGLIAGGALADTGSVVSVL